MTLSEIEQQIGTAIGQQETAGGKTGVGVTLANPGGLRYATWEAKYGGVPDPSGFARFPSLDSGWAALRDRVTQIVGNGASITGLIDKWAPAGDGNTNNAGRVSQIASITKLDPASPITGQAGAQTSQDASAGPDWGKILRDAGVGALGPLGSIAAATDAKDQAVTAGDGSGSGFSWGRIAAFVLGAALILIALAAVALTTGVTVVNQTLDRGGAIGKTAKRVAETAAMAA